jgi:hypothetical protein
LLTPVHACTAPARVVMCSARKLAIHHGDLLLAPAAMVAVLELVREGVMNARR